MHDILGQRGEAIFYVLMTEYHAQGGLSSQGGPIFRPQFLGDKWPTVDFIVELIGTGPSVPYFFVQVKTTRKGLTKRERRLKVKIKEADASRLVAFPAPSYIVGIDEVEERGYIVSAREGNGAGLSSLSTVFPITTQTRQALWDEVHAYWGSHQLPDLNSTFVDLAWR